MKMIVFLNSQLPGIKELLTESEALVLMLMHEAAPLPSSPCGGSGRELTSAKLGSDRIFACSLPLDVKSILQY